ncbi:PREDICTED: uncharacterized protein LOC104592131 isoform X2 [Nelumbo nucifera]|uniref:Uncharacterized protein LOC104592131 isoform X2 n=1 Tax=Nelumbo nucifera TaxID=4432 RepID=A0A1U7ZAI7_NELNU|nr:PREDICTED: uncharacterized protein LOC104592131 isoform X2 [Nelumbo nucifera]
MVILLDPLVEAHRVWGRSGGVHNWARTSSLDSCVHCDTLPPTVADIRIEGFETAPPIGQFIQRSNWATPQAFHLPSHQLQSPPESKILSLLTLDFGWLIIHLSQEQRYAN